MFALSVSVLAALSSFFQTRAALQLEILALRHQINVLRRSQRGRVQLSSADRLFWTWLIYLWSGWRSALAIVKPETVIAWHRKKIRLYWTWKSRQGRPGRPQVCIHFLPSTYYIVPVHRKTRHVFDARREASRRPAWRSG